MKSFVSILFLLFTIIHGLESIAQTGIWKLKPQVDFLAFTDLYYGKDLNAINTNNRSPYLYNHNRNQVLATNLTLLQFSLKHSKYRATFGIQAGTYVVDNMSMEPSYLQPIHNAHFGFSLSKKDCLWLDAGIFNAHLGFENAQSTENLTLKRSLAAEQSPYFLTGVKLNYVLRKKLSFTALILNGWQHIAFLKKQSLPSIGTNIQWKPVEKWNISWSTFIGSEFPDSERKMRYFNNLFAQYSSKKWNFILGFDLGIQQVEKKSNNYQVWFVPTLIGQYCLTNKWKTAIRIEYLQDNSNVIIPQFSTSIFSSSWNWDYQPIDLLTLRLEARYFHGLVDAMNTNINRISILGSIAFRFQKIWKP